MTKSVFLQLFRASSTKRTVNSSLEHTPIFSQASSQKNHLIVLAHGLFGFPTDLDFLADQLRKRGCVVLQSQSNTFDKTVNGIPVASERLANEIKEFLVNYPQLSRISFVGNSLGGLFARHAVKLLYNSKDHSMGGLKPHKFMTIASPHLGVLDYTYFDDLGIKIPENIKRRVGQLYSKSGNELFLDDRRVTPRDISKSLLFEMATSENFLIPLKTFEARRLYANLKHDFFVPLGTAAILPKDKVTALRKSFKYKNEVRLIPSQSDSFFSNLSNPPHHTSGNPLVKDAAYVNDMINGLDSCGWERVVVNFSANLGFLPLSHNKICAQSPGPRAPPFIPKLLRFFEGESVMEDAAVWLTSN